MVAPKQMRSTSSQNHGTHTAPNDASAATIANRSSSAYPGGREHAADQRPPSAEGEAGNHLRRPACRYAELPASTGIVGMIIAQAPEKNVLTYSAIKLRRLGLFG
jgi:hypothetical protein